MSPENLHGSWRLVRIFKHLNGVETDGFALGKDPAGYIHYLPDGRVSVIIAHGGRKLLSGGRWNSPDAEMATEARKFDAYAGTFEVMSPTSVVHQLDMSSFENDRYATYPRSMKLEGDLLTLGTPAVETDEGRVEMFLTWQRVAA